MEKKQTLLQFRKERGIASIRTLHKDKIDKMLKEVYPYSYDRKGFIEWEDITEGKNKNKTYIWALTITFEDIYISEENISAGYQFIFEDWYKIASIFSKVFRKNMPIMTGIKIDFKNKKLQFFIS